MKFAYSFILLSSSLLLFSIPCNAEYLGLDTVNINGDLDSIISLGETHLFVFCDTSHSMDYEIIRHLDKTHFHSVIHGKFKPQEKHANSYWLKFIITNNSLTKESKLFLNSKRLDITSVYQKNEFKIDTLKFGRLLSIQNRVIPDGRNLPIIIPPNQTFEFLCNPNMLYDIFDSYQLFIQSENYYYKNRVNDLPRVLNYNTFQGLFYGFIFFVMIFSFLLFILEQDKVYIYYSLYLLGIATYYLIGGVTTMTTPFSYLIEHVHSLRYTLSFFIFFIYLLFLVEFIYTKENRNLFVVKVIFFSAKVLFSIIIIDLFLRSTTGIIFYKYFFDELRFILLGIAIITTLAMMKSIGKNKFAKYILAGTLLLLLFGVINFPLYMYKPGHIKGGISYTQIGVLVEVIFFSIGLSLRSRSRLLSARQNEIKINRQLNEEKLAKIQIQKDKAIFQQKLAETELKALRAQINPHFISNALNSIKNLVQNQEGKKAEEYLADFSQLIRTILINSNKAYIFLQEEIDYCKEYLKIESLRFDNSFNYEVNISKNIDATYVKIPPLLLQPYIENAIWHGLLQKKGHRLLLIKAVQKEDYVSLIIDDNGIGREAAAKNNLNNKQNKSYGITITKERINTYNGLYEADLQVKIIDKKDKFGNALGTRVELTLPL